MALIILAIFHSFLHGASLRTPQAPDKCLLNDIIHAALPRAHMESQFCCSNADSVEKIRFHAERRGNSGSRKVLQTKPDQCESLTPQMTAVAGIG